MTDAPEEDLRWLPHDNEESDPDYVLFRLLHKTALPNAIYLTDVRSEQLAQVAWLAERDRTLEAMSLYEFYLGPIQLSELVFRAERVKRATLQALIARTPLTAKFWDA